MGHFTGNKRLKSWLFMVPCLNKIYIQTQLGPGFCLPTVSSARYYVKASQAEGTAQVMFMEWWMVQQDHRAGGKESQARLRHTLNSNVSEELQCLCLSPSSSLTSRDHYSCLYAHPLRSILTAMSRKPIDYSETFGFVFLTGFHGFIQLHEYRPVPLTRQTYSLRGW